MSELKPPIDDPKTPTGDEDDEDHTVMQHVPEDLIAESVRGAKLKAQEQAGLRQMFSRDPAPVRKSLPNEREGDALLAVLFDDAQGDAEPEAEAPPPPAVAPVAATPAPARAVAPPPRPAAARSMAATPPPPKAAATPPPARAAATPPPRPIAATPPPRAAATPPPARTVTPRPPVAAAPPPEPVAPPPVEEADAGLTEPAAEAIDESSATEVADAAVEQAAAVEAPPTPAPHFDDEEDAAAHLVKSHAVEAWIERAGWLREEAEVVEDKAARSRALLVVSELYAMAGEHANSHTIAEEARDLAPSSPLAHRQVRGPFVREGDWAHALEAIEAETKSLPTPAARCHSALVAAEITRLGIGDEEAAAKRIDMAQRTQPTDPRPHVHRLAALLARSENDETTAAQLGKTRYPDAPELAPLSATLGRLVAYRGGTSKGKAGTTAYETLLRARAALVAGDAGSAIAEIADLGRAESLRAGSGWLGAALAAANKDTRSKAVDLLGRVVEGSHGPLARRALAARAIELGDAAAARGATASAETTAFTAADRVTLGALAGGARADVDPWMDSVSADPELAPIAVAVSAVLEGGSVLLVGGDGSRARSSLGRALGRGDEEDLAAALQPFVELDPDGPLGRVVALELDYAAGSGGKVALALSAWRDDAESERDRNLASALIAEVAGEPERALAAFDRVRASDPTLEVAVRALGASASADDYAERLAEHAQHVEPATRGAILLVEAALRIFETKPEEAEVWLKRAAELDATLPFSPHLGERAARARGDRDGLVEWLRTRREASADPVEQAHDLVREALLVSDAEGAPGPALLEQALRARPGDVGLRELYERLAPDTSADRAAWRATRAAETTGAEAVRLALEAAYEFERAGDFEAMAKCAERAVKAGDTGLGPILVYRAAVGGQGTGEVVDALIPHAREAADPIERLETYERLAELDERGRGDVASGLLWRRTILEETPGHLPTLRRVAGALMAAGRDDDLEPVVFEIAKALDGAEAIGHAMLSARLRLRASGWDDTREPVEIAYRFTPHTIWALRQMSAHAHARGAHELALEVDRQLIEKTQRPSEAATLSLRASESALKAEKIDEALAFLSHAIEVVPGHLVAHLHLATALDQSSNHAGAAASLEAAADASVAPTERMHNLYRAALLWQDKVEDTDRARSALERVADIDPAFGDVFERLQAVYVAAGARAELAALLKRRLDRVTDPKERVEMEVLRGRALADVGDASSAKRALASALEANPDHIEALSAFADVAAIEEDWTGAEQAWIRLARLVSDADRQASIYLRLGELYDEHLPNPERAELAYQEILKRRPADTQARGRLVALFQRSGDAPRAIEQQTVLINGAESPEDKCLRTTELARIYESTADLKKAEATLLQARKSWPKDDVALGALAEFYQRHNQAQAAQLLLDRAVADARRALGTGRFESHLFGTIATVARLRNRPDAARVSQAVVASLEGDSADVDGAGATAGDMKLDEHLAPEVMTAAFRDLLRKSGPLLDAAMPFDLASIRATPLPGQQQDLADLVRMLGQGYGLTGVQVHVSGALGSVCVPAGSNPPTIVLGQPLLSTPREDVRAFLIHRALKIVQTNAAALSRTAPIDLGPLLAAYLKALSPSWTPQGVDAAKLTDFYGKISRVAPKPIDPQLGLLAAEVIGSVGNRASTLSTVVNGWGNRAALLATGDLNVAMVAIAWSGGHTNAPPASGKDRMTWIGRNAEARELVVFAVSDGYSDARVDVGITEAEEIDVS